MRALSGEAKRRTWSLKRFAIGASVFAAAAIAAAAAGLYVFAQSLGPLDVTVAQERSPVVVDRDGRLLRPFTTKDGRWRIPVAASEVDPRYLTILTAYEDRRFERHDGVDLRAMARAAVQLAAHGRIVSGGSTLTMTSAPSIFMRKTFGF